MNEDTKLEVLYTLSWILWFVLNGLVYFMVIRPETVGDPMDRLFSALVMAIVMGLVVSIISRRVEYRIKKKPYPYFL